MEIFRATKDDSRDIWLWRNDEVTRAMSVNSRYLEWAEHSEWFEKVVLNPDAHVYVGKLNGRSVGMCRFDVDTKNKSAEISINFNPDMRGQGLSRLLLSLSIRTFRAEKDLEILARIKKINFASVALFEKSGFSCYGEGADFYFYKLQNL